MPLRTPPPQRVEIEDVQGIILRGYSALEASCVLALRIKDPAGARSWLRKIADDVTSAADPVTDRHLNIAFTYPAFVALGLPEITLSGFRSAFYHGMVGGGGRTGDAGGGRTGAAGGSRSRADSDHTQRLSHRSLALGDVGASAPSTWAWGNAANPIHIALLLYDRTDEGIREFVEEHHAQLEAHGLSLVETCWTTTLPGRKEHFGFRDGIAQPALRNANPRGQRPGVLEADRPDNTVEPGEFLLGYRNQYGEMASGPGVEDDSERIVALGRPVERISLLHHDFGHNGSFLVWRQLAQRVPEFWRDVRNIAQEDQPIAHRHLAAKLFGRWPSGAPLALAPEVEDIGLADENDYSFADDDPHGYLTPFGAHTRRANPRDWHFSPDRKQALAAANKHRLIRRGRPYGPPVAPSMNPEDILAAGQDSRERGLHFLCFVADIERQFEVVQSNWLNDPNFGRLHDEVDPLLGEKSEAGGAFTLQATPIRKRIDGLGRYVEVRGGAYLFMPGVRALHYLASRE